MNAPSEPLSSKDVDLTQEEIRNPEPSPARTRESLVQRVLAARKRLPRTSANGLGRAR
jgi:hypothetical protein